MHSYKIGNNKGRPRIWLDGKRLTEAGFVGGTTYYCYVSAEEKTDTTYSAGNIVCRLKAAPEMEGAEMRKVTARADGKPIIDMLGADVEAAFPGAERVNVVFSPGRIIITRA